MIPESPGFNHGEYVKELNRTKWQEKTTGYEKSSLLIPEKQTIFRTSK